MFDVYVEGVATTSPDAVRDLAHAMAARYGVPAAELQARLSRGRFRVKADVSRTTAEAYVRDLEAIGARVRIEPARNQAADTDDHAPADMSGGAPSPRSPTRSSLPPQSEPRPARSSLPPQPESRPAHSSLPPQPESRPARSSLPPQPESRPARSSLPPSSGVRDTRSSLPPPSGARDTRSSLPPPSRTRDTRSLLPPQPESRPAHSLLPPPSGTRDTRSSLPPQPESRRTHSSLPPPESWPARSSPAGLDPRAAMSEPANGDPQIGPTAAAPFELGALDRSGALSLATLDDEPAGTAPSDGTLPASIGPAAARTTTRPRPQPEPVDRFVPPEMAAAEPVLELADDELAYRASKRASRPPPVAESRRGSPSQPPEVMQGRRPAPSHAPGSSDRWSTPSQLAGDSPSRASGAAHAWPSTPVLANEPGAPDLTRRSTPRSLADASGWYPAAPPASSVPHASRATTADRASAGEPGAAAARRGVAARYPLLGSARGRLAVGVVLAIVLGFVPAHLVSEMREQRTCAAIDARVVAAQTAADTRDSYAALDTFRAAQLDAKRSARRTSLVMLLAIWAATGGALAYVWFRRIPWDRRDAPTH